MISRCVNMIGKKRKIMIIRIRGQTGASRVEVVEDGSLSQLYELVSAQVVEAQGRDFTLSLDPAGTHLLPFTDKSLREYNLKHGEMLFLKITNPETPPTEPRLISDAVDTILDKASGQIPRKRDPQYCRHGNAGMCSHCQPLEPFDEGYMKEKGIKHLSFHAYLRKIGAKPGSLDEPNYRIKEGCTRHAPYPAGICSQCQPAAISLNPQQFRFTDHVEFEQPILVEKFLAGWREQGYQRFGWLFGRFEGYDVVPLGIKAVVCAIYEPPQDGSIDGFQLLDDPEHRMVLEAATLLGLSCVGMIYTDLKDDGTRSGKVECRRHVDSFFLSSTEVLFIAHQQHLHPNPCRYSSTGKYGSKFVTVVVTGDESNDVGLFAYQASMTAEAMLEAEIISATTDPALLMVNPGDPTHFIPEVFYKYRNEYGSEVQTIAAPTFPVDYLVVSLTHGFPVKANPLFSSTTVDLSRPTMIAKYLLPIPTNDDSLMKMFSNFNFFIFLTSVISRESATILAKAIKERNVTVIKEFLHTDEWAHIMDMIEERTTTTPGTRKNPIPIDDHTTWTCPHCTFINTSSKDSCEVCGLPPS